MNIEFLGPSCAGKSSLMTHVADELSRTDTPVTILVGYRRAHRAHLRDLAAALKYPRVAAWCLLNPRRTLSRRGQELLGAAGQVRRTVVRDPVTMIDEGPVRRLSKLLDGSRFPTLLARAVPRPDLVVMVTCDFDVRLQRLRATARPHAAVQSDEEIAATDRARAQWNAWICDTLDLPVVSVDTTTGEDHTEFLAEYIRSSLASSGS